VLVCFVFSFASLPCAFQVAALQVVALARALQGPNAATPMGTGASGGARSGAGVNDSSDPGTPLTPQSPGWVSVGSAAAPAYSGERVRGGATVKLG